MADSAECWLNTSPKVLLYHHGKSTATFHLPRMPWDLKHWVYTASHANVARFILNNVVDLFKL
jgi:hypothetical protein